VKETTSIVSTGITWKNAVFYQEMMSGWGITTTYRSRIKTDMAKRDRQPKKEFDFDNKEVLEIYNKLLEKYGRSKTIHPEGESEL